MPYRYPSTSKTEAKDGKYNLTKSRSEFIRGGKVNDGHSVEQKSASLFQEGMIS
jgi:hypothetical protein